MNCRGASRFTFAVASLISALVFAACSGGGSSASGDAKARVHASKADASATSVPWTQYAPCNLLDQAQANKFFNVTTTKEQFADERKCVRAAGNARLSIAIWQQQSRSQYDGYKASRADSQVVKGIGDSADFSADDATLQFLKGNTVITVQLENATQKASAIKPFLVEQAKYAASKV